MALALKTPGVMAIMACLAISCTTPSADAPGSVAAATAASDSIRPGVHFAPYIDRSEFKVAYRRLTESQYRNVVADVFGSDVKINARFEPEQRIDGLLAIGNAQQSISTAGLEQYVSVAHAIADQVIDSDQRDIHVGCKPAGEATADQTCAEQFIRGVGANLFRRPLSSEELARRMDVWRTGYQATGDFHQALKLSLVTLLVAPEFLFRTERAESEPENPAAVRLDAYTKASRLSFMLWDAGPDAELLQAAYSGDIHTAEGYRRQVERLLASDRLKQGARAFFVDMLHFEAFDNLVKDPTTYPKFSQNLADSAREETLRFLVDHLVERGEDYRDIFTTRNTILNRTLASVYNVPFASADPWAMHTFNETSGRAGIQSQITFLSLFSHPGRSSPTIRGVRLYEIFLCFRTPDPPADVDFSKVDAMATGTVRERLMAHMTNPGCSTCHQLTDPVGLALENFDGIGQHRTHENGELIDITGEIGGRTFNGAAGVGEYLHDSPQVPACLVRNMHYYGQGRAPDFSEQSYLNQQTEAFASAGHRLPDLYRNIVMSPEFLTVVPPKAAPRATAQGPGSGVVRAAPGE